MAEHNLEGKIGGFAVGLAAGLLLNGAVKKMYERVRAGEWRHEYERTASYQQNLPDQLERREPAPHQDQPRYGGTGALGVHPEAIKTTELLP